MCDLNLKLTSNNHNKHNNNKSMHDSTEQTQLFQDNNNNNIYDLIQVLQSVLKKYKLKELAILLNLAPGTITRWIELNDIPKHYEFDLLKLLGIKIDYSKYDTKLKDQFFTPVETAESCFKTFCQVIKEYGDNPDDYIYIEPSAGDGGFLSVLPCDKTIALDIEPRNSNIIEQDYLDWKPNTTTKSKYTVFGNPPFGLRGHLALRFINHSYEFADYVAFILPQLFESDGKGVPRKRVKGYNLIYSEKIVSNFYEPDKSIVKINTIFQIWSKYHINDKYQIQNLDTEKMKIYSLSDGGTASSTRNKNMIGNCDIYIPSTCFGKDNMRWYDSFEKLPGKKGYGIVFIQNKEEMLDKSKKIIWSDIAFLSTNSAYNLRSSQIYNLFN
jgi:hypothetical protein